MPRNAMHVPGPSGGVPSHSSRGLRPIRRLYALAAVIAIAAVAILVVLATVPFGSKAASTPISAGYNYAEGGAGLPSNWDNFSIPAGTTVVFDWTSDAVSNTTGSWQTQCPQSVLYFEGTGGSGSGNFTSCGGSNRFDASGNSASGGALTWWNMTGSYSRAAPNYIL